MSSLFILQGEWSGDKEAKNVGSDSLPFAVHGTKGFIPAGVLPLIELRAVNVYSQFLRLK